MHELSRHKVPPPPFLTFEHLSAFITFEYEMWNGPGGTLPW